ncbi:MAG: hypothetical protein P1R58_09295, partial [bacterium]|nr:hypothetical protein [bacterium]
SRELMRIIGSNQYGRESGEERRRRLKALQNEMTSQAYIYQLISELNLDNDPKVAREAAELRESSPQFTLEQLKYNILLKDIRERISVAFVGTDQIRIQITSNDPVLARDMVTKLTEIMEIEKTKYELEKILDNQNFADLQLEKTESMYQEAIDSLTKAQRDLLELKLPDDISSESNQNEILADIEKSRQDRSDFRERAAQLSSRLKELDLDRSRLNHTDSLIRLRTGIDGQVSDLAGMMGTYAWTAQNVITATVRLNNRIRAMEREIAGQTAIQFHAFPADQQKLLEDFFVATENEDVYNSKINQYQASFERLINRISALPRLQARITDLEQRVGAARRYRDAFQDEGRTVDILSEQAKERTKYKVIEPARIPLAPSWPNRKKVTVLGFMLGLVLGGVVALLSEIMDGSYKRTEDVEDDLGIPVIAVLPKIDKLKFR